METNDTYMRKAIEIAHESGMKGDYPVAAVIVKDGEIISTGMNRTRTNKDPAAHAEMEAIRSACKKLDAQYLPDCILYTTHEPCPMCAGAAIWAKMKGIVFGAYKEDAMKNKGRRFPWRQIDISCKDVIAKGEPKLELVEGFLNKECNELFRLTK